MRALKKNREDKKQPKISVFTKLGFMQGFNNNIQGEMGVEGKIRYNQDTYIPQNHTHPMDLHIGTARR